MINQFHEFDWRRLPELEKASDDIRTKLLVLVSASRLRQLTPNRISGPVFKEYASRLDGQV